MDERRKSLKCHSLPPMVEGKVNGYLTMKVDEVVWCRNCHIDTVILVKWWGENKAAIFGPLNVKTGSSGTVKNTTIIYAVKTTINLFEEYLKDCEGLELSVVDERLHSVVGHVLITDILSIVKESIFQRYFPILNNFGNRIGDIHVGFSLQLIRNQVSPCVMIQSKSSEKRTSESSRQKCAENENKIIKPRKKKSRHYSEYHTIPSSYSLPNLSKNKINDVTVSDSLISNLLEQGQKLRDAMVKSVLEDGGLDLVEKNIGDFAAESPSSKRMGRRNKRDKQTTEEDKIMEFLLGKSMTPEDEEDAIQRLKNLSPVGSLLEMAEDLSKDEKFVTDQQEPEGKRKDMDSEEEYSCHILEDKDIESRNNEEHSIQYGASKQDIPESLQSAPIYHEDFIMQYIDSLRITVHSLRLNKKGNKNHSHAKLQTKGSTVHFLHEVSKKSGTVYFVEYELPYPLDPVLRGKKRQTKESRKPWHNTVKRFCSKKHIGPEIYFGQNSVHMLPVTKTPLYKLLTNVNIKFRIFSRQLHQKIPLQIGEVEFRMSEILKSESLGCSEPIQFFCTANRPDYQLCEGVLKVSVELGSEGKYFGDRFLSVLNDGYCDIDADVLNEPDNGTSLKNSAVSLTHKPSPTSDASHGVQNDTKKMFTSKLKKKQTLHKTKQPSPRSEDILSASGSDSGLNKSVLLHGLLHISEGRGFENVNSYLVCRAFWKEDIITSDVCWNTGNPHYNFHQLIPVLLSADLIERSHNNFLITELWERKLPDYDTLIGVAKLPLNKFYVAYRDPGVVTQLLLSKYPVIAVDGWMSVMNPVTQMPYGQIRVVLALGTEDQVQLLEVSRGLKETILTPSSHCSQDTQYCIQSGSGDRRGDTKMSGERNISTEPSLCSVVNSSDTIIDSLGGSQIRDVNSGGGVGSATQYPRPLIPPQQNYDFHEACVSLLDRQESTVLHKKQEQNGYPRNISGNINGTQDIFTHSSRKQQDVFAVNVPNSVNNVHVTSSYQSSKSKPKVVQQRMNEDARFNGKLFENVKDSQRRQYGRNSTKKNVSVQKHEEQNNLPIVTETTSVTNLENCDFEDSLDQHLEQLIMLEKSNERFGSEMFSKEVLKDNQTGYHKKHKGSQTDLFTVDLKDYELRPLQNSFIPSEGAWCHLPVNQTYDNHFRNSSMLNRDLGNAINSNLLGNNCMAEDKSVQFPQVPEDLSSGSENRSKQETASHANNQCGLAENNVVNVSGEDKSKRLPEESISLGIADPASCFRVHVEIESAMHLQCYKQQKRDERNTGSEVDPSTYVTFLLKQGGSASKEADVRMFTPLVPQTVNPEWHWHCDTWLPSDLLTDSDKRLIFKVWQSVDGSLKDPEKDIVLGFATVDLTVLLCGMPWVSGWFNIMDFAGRCAGQIKINVTPLENLNCFNPRTVSDHKMIVKDCSTYREEYVPECMCERTCSNSGRQQGTVTVLDSQETSKSMCDKHHSSLERSGSKQRDDTDPVSHHIRRQPDTIVTESSADCEADVQDDMTSSFLAHALKLKLAELDEITQRLKKRLHVVTDEDFSQPCLPWLQENEIALDIQEIDDDINGGINSKIGASSCINLANSNDGLTVKPTGKSTTKGKQDPVKKHTHFHDDLEADTSLQFTNKVSSEKQKNNSDKDEKTAGNSKVVYFSNSTANRSMVNHRELSHNNLEFESSYNQENITNTRTRSPPVDLRQEDGVEEFDKLTDYLMQKSARELELENVFNPLLFQHLLSSCGALSDCHYENRTDVDNPSSSLQLGKSSIANTKFTRNRCLRNYSQSHGHNHNSNLSGTKEVNRVPEDECEINDATYDLASNNVPSGSTELTSVVKSNNKKSLKIATLPESDCDSASAKSLRVSACAEQKEETISSSKVLLPETRNCRSDVSSNSSSEVSFIVDSVNELNISNGSMSDDSNHETSVFVPRQAPEGGNTMEEDSNVIPASVVVSAGASATNENQPTDSQRPELSVMKPSLQSKEQLSKRPFSSSQLFAQPRLDNRNEESDVDLSRTQANKKGTHSLINEEKIRQIAKIFNMNVTSPDV